MMAKAHRAENFLLGEGLGIGHVLVHALIGGLVICQNGIHVVDDDGLLVGIPANFIAQGIGHQAKGDIGAVGGGVDIGGGLTSVVPGHLGGTRRGGGSGVALILDAEGVGANGQPHGHVPLAGFAAVEGGIGDIGLRGGDGAGGGIPGHILFRKAKLLEYSHKGQAGSAVFDLGHRIGKGDILIVGQHIEVPLLGGDGSIRLHGEGGDADGGGHQRRAQGGAKYMLHAKHSF